jgi:hypothetical protein
LTSSFSPADCCRYLHENCLREDFLTFLEVHEKNSLALAQLIINSLNSLGLDSNKLRGQGYDGAAVMSGHLTGVQATIREKAPKAVFSSCASHALNLVLCKSCELAPIRNMIGIISEISAFFSQSSLRSDAVKNEISVLLPSNKSKKLVSFCATRWVERHSALISFLELFPAVHATLEKLSSERRDVNAHLLLKGICNFQFIVALHVAVNASTIFHSLSKQLQSGDIDLPAACLHLSNVAEELERQRSAAEIEFSHIFVSMKGK